MNKSNEEILKDLKESVLKSVSNSTYKLSEPDRNRRVLAQDLVKSYNNMLLNSDVPIYVEQEDGSRVLLTEPRLVYNEEKSTASILSFSLVGKLNE